MSTWKCGHIASTEVVERLEAVCLELGYLTPTSCTQDLLLGDSKYVRSHR